MSPELSNLIRHLMKTFWLENQAVWCKFLKNNKISLFYTICIFQTLQTLKIEKNKYQKQILYKQEYF